MRYLGHLLLWSGFLAAAFVSLSRLEQSENKWETIHWGNYLVSMLVGVVGIVLLRLTSRKHALNDARTEAEYSIIQSSLERLRSVVQTLCEQTSYVPQQVVRTIDDECAQPLADFAEARQSLVNRYGLETYANVMTEFASAERYINRTWSAAADGYVDEVAASLRRANQHLQNTDRVLQAAESDAEQSAISNREGSYHA